MTYQKVGKMEPKHNVRYEEDIPREYEISYIQTSDGGFELVTATQDEFKQTPIDISTPDDIDEQTLIELWSGKYFHESLKPHLEQLRGHALTTNSIMNTVLYGTPKGNSTRTVWETGCDPTYPYEQDLVGAIYHTSKAIRKAIERHEYDNHRNFPNERWKHTIWYI